MRHDESKEVSTEPVPKKWGIKRILHYLQYPVIAIIIIGTLYLIINPEPLKVGKKLAKEGDYMGAISEFSMGLDDYYNNNLPGGRRGRRFVAIGYKMNIHNFHYNIALSYDALGKIAESENNIQDSIIYYAYAIEAYDSTLLEKEKHKKSIEAIAIVETKFEELYGEPYVMGTIFESDEEETDTIKAIPAISMSEDDMKAIADQQIKAGQTLIDSGNYEMAIAQYDVGLYYATNNIELHELKLVALYELEDYKKAKESVKSLLKLDKNNAIAKNYKDMM